MELGKMDTLDEPVSATLMRDLNGILSKLRILIPVNSSQVYRNVVKEWDLWGPLIVCTILSLFLHHSEESDNGIGPNFAEIFVLLWAGSYVVSLNYRLLSLSSQSKHEKDGGDSSTNLFASPSIFQLMCVLGYSMAPAIIGVLFIRLTGLIFGFSPMFLFTEKLFVGTVCGFIWPTLSAHKVLSKYQHKDKSLLATYPIGLLYFVLAWIIISHH